MTLHLPEFPIFLVDFVGSALMIVLSLVSTRYAYRLLRLDPRQLLWSYLYIFTLALTAFSVGRGVGHIVRNILVLTGHRELWLSISPYSGALNTITFVIIAAITIYYQFAEKAFSMLEQAHSKLGEAFVEIRRRRDQIILMERHAITDRMAATLAHETRNPIFTIANFAKILLRKCENEDASVEYLKIIVEESRKLEGLINGILKAKRDLPYLMRRVPVSEVLVDLERIGTDRAEASKVEVRVASVREELWLHVDMGSLLAGMAEVILNAIEASPRGGVVDISVLHEGDKAIFRVADTGVGIPQEVLPNIFDPGFSTKQFSHGLGLAFAREIFEANQGVVEIESELGRGTTALVTLSLDTGDDLDEFNAAVGAG